MRAVAIVLAAGRGVRLGQSLPKAWVQLEGRSLVHWSAAALARAPGVERVVCVLPPEGAAWVLLAPLRADWPGPAPLEEPVTGGPTRQASLANALEALAARCIDATWVLVHDAARCLVEPEDAAAVLEAARATGAALPVVPSPDTVKLLREAQVVETLERSSLGLAQTPQAFRTELLREAVAKALRDGFVGSDCASLVERLGVVVRTCAGRAGNFKVTHADDLVRAAALLAARRQAEEQGA